MHMTTRLIAATVAGLALLAAPAAAQTVEQRHSVQASTMLAKFAILHALDEETAFAEARAAGDRDAMQHAAVGMVNNLTTAEAHLVRLDAEVTAAGYSEQLDADVLSLLGNVAQARDAIDDYALAGDMKGLGTAVDRSQDWFNEMRLHGRRVMDEVTAHRG